jgi:DNA-binding transcriptional LysR family regulator
VPIVSIDETARYIDELDVDIAITREPLKQPGVLELPFLEDELVAVAAPALAAKLPASRPEIHGQRAGLLCLETDMTSERVGPFIRAHLAGLRKLAIYDDPRLLLDACLRGRGVALLSRLLADEALRAGMLKRLKAYPTLPGGTVWISRVEGEPRMPLVKDVFDCLIAYAKLS